MAAVSSIHQPKLVMAGISCIDHIWQVSQFPPSASRTHATSYRMQGGGPAATAAATAARLGAQVSLIAVHGQDVNGQAAQAELESFGVDCRQLIRLADRQTIVSGILVAPGGERYIFPYMDGDVTDLPLPELSFVADSDCVLTDGRYPQLAEAVLKLAGQANIPVVGDFSKTENWQLTQWVDYLIVSEECATEFLGRNDPEVALAAMKQFEGQLVGVTLGEEGFLYEQQGRRRHLPALQVEVVDTTGAGDVFHGAYAYAVARRWDVDQCALFASVTAALKCTALGGRSGIPDLPTVLGLLEERSSRDYR